MPQPRKPACPSCGGHNLRLSGHASLKVRLEGLITFRRPYRCRDCRASLWLSWSEHRGLRTTRRNGALGRLLIRIANYRGQDLRCPVCGSPEPRRERPYKLHERFWSQFKRYVVWECPYCRNTFMGQRVGRYED